MRTLGELKTQIADWLNREDLGGQIPEFIRMAEDEIYAGLRTRENEFVKVIEPYLDPDFPEDNIDPINPIDLPQNFKEIKLVIADGEQYCHVSDQEYYALTRFNNDRKAFTIVERQLWMNPWPDETPEEWLINRIEIHYYGTESLIDMTTWDTPTNPSASPINTDSPDYLDQPDDNTTRLFQTYPHVFLHGALYFAHIFLQMDNRAQYFRNMFDNGLMAIRMEQNSSEFSGSTVSVKSVYGG